MSSVSVPTVFTCVSEMPSPLYSATIWSVVGTLPELKRYFEQAAALKIDRHWHAA